MAGAPDDNRTGMLMDGEAELRTIRAHLEQAMEAPSRLKQREYLAAMAAQLADEGAVTHADVARRLGKAPTALSYLRARLLAKGTIFSDGRSLRFLVPGMAAWILDTDERR